MQLCTSLQTDNHASTAPLSFYRPDSLPATQPTASKHWRHKKIDYNYTDNQACNTHAEQHPKDAIIQSNNILQTFLAKIYKQVILFQFSLQQMKAVTWPWSNSLLGVINNIDTMLMNSSTFANNDKNYISHRTTHMGITCLPQAISHIQEGVSGG